MFYLRLCKRHTTYAARKKPQSNCPGCWQAWRKEQKKYDIVGRAADQLSDLLKTDVTLEAKYHRTDGRGDAGIRVEVIRK